MPRPSSPTLLIDVELPEPEPMPPALLDLLSDVHVVLLGWYDVPEQTSPEQARDQFAGEAAEALARTARPFEEAGLDVRKRLVFTGSKFDTISRITREEDCDAVYLAGSLDALRRVLVPLRGTQNLGSIAAVVTNIARGGSLEVTLLHVLEDEEQEAHVHDAVFVPARATLAEHGTDPDAITARFVEADDPSQTIIDAAVDHDLIILGESEPTIREILFGTVPKAIARAADIPVVVVRHLREDVQQAERAVEEG
jgi:nucleotide-binding universal stress UspA family protein